jgi:hypothetical protein
MMPLADVACAVMMTLTHWNGTPQDTVRAEAVRADTVRVDTVMATPMAATPAAATQPVALVWHPSAAVSLAAESSTRERSEPRERIVTGLGIADAAQDTVRKARKKAFVYSDGYQTRLTIHKWLSWGMLPLFAASYFTGDELLKANAVGRTPKEWARQYHGPAASATAVLFTANTLTGAWNLVEGIGDPNGRTRRVLHSVLFMLASGGFVYAGTQLANDAEQSQDKRVQHRNVALASMGVSTFSWLIMLIGN